MVAQVLAVARIKSRHELHRHRMAVVPVMKGSKCAEIVEIEQLTAYLLDSNMVSNDVAGIYPGDQSGLQPTITE